MRCVSRRIELPIRLSLRSDSGIVSLPQNRLNCGLAARIRRTVEKYPLAEGIYRDASFPDMPLRRLANVLIDSSESALDRAILARKMFHLYTKSGELPLSFNYLPDSYRVISSVRTAGEVYQESITTDGRRMMVSLTAAEEVYLVFISLLRRASINAYPAYLVDESEKSFQLAIFIRDLDRDNALSFMCLHDSEIEFQTVEILGDGAMKAVMYAVAAENVVKALFALLGTEELPLNIIEIVEKMTQRAHELITAALRIDPNCLKALQAIANLQAIKNTAYELNRKRILSIESVVPVTTETGLEGRSKSKGETLH